MIPLMKNAFLNEHETKKALADFILQAGRLSMDAECLRFERKFSEYQGRKESILFNSGGSANLVMLEALRSEFGLRYERIVRPTGMNATDNKPHDYSLIRKPEYLFGYEPKACALDIVIQHARQLLGAARQRLSKGRTTG